MASAAKTRIRTPAAKATGHPPKRKLLTAKWARLIRQIPGYDPIATAEPGDWFDPAEAQRVIDFFPRFLRHVKGELAGQAYELTEWEQAIVANLFGWKRLDEKGRQVRRYTEAFIYVPKKNDKTTLCSGLVIYGLTQDKEHGAEVYSAASSKEQAAIVFGTVCGMVKKNPKLSEVLKLYGHKGGGNIRSVMYERTLSFYRPLSSDEDTADGVNVHMAVVDELHRHKSGALMDVLIRSTSARTQPLVIVITTADYDRESACNRKYAQACRVRDNGGDRAKAGYNPRFLPVIYEAALTDDWTDEAVWRKANPNLGRSKKMEYMRAECAKAREDPVVRNDFLRLDLNVQTQQSEALIDMAAWDNCPRAGMANLSAFLARPCVGGLDLSQSDDLSAFCMLFPPPADESNGVWFARWRFWCPAAMIEKRRHSAIPYDVWRDEGWIEETQGNVIDFPLVRGRIVEDAARFTGLVEVGFDPYSATQMAQELGDQDGIQMVVMRQGFQTMSEPTKRTLDLVRSGRLDHGGNPVARWMASNAMDRKDCNGNQMPVKDRSKDKIDGISALVMAVGRGIVMQPPKPAMTGETYEKLMQALGGW